MGLFWGRKTDDTPATSATPSSVEREGTQVDYAPQGGLLNLQKNNILDLRKYSDSLNKVRVAAGWDIAKGRSSFDLDLCAFLLDANGRGITKVYYGAKSSTGIKLDGDNLTGEGEGDDENINVTLEKIPANVSSIVFSVVIFNASVKGQHFEDVENAFCRLVDESNGKEICKFSLSEDGGKNTAVTFAELYRNDGGWSFRTIGTYSKDSIDSLYHKY